jgi:hypothetical protein
MAASTGMGCPLQRLVMVEAESSGREVASGLSR